MNDKSSVDDLLAGGVRRGRIIDRKRPGVSDKDNEIAFGIARLKVLRIVAATFNGTSYDALSDKIAPHLDDVIGPKGKFSQKSCPIRRGR